MATVQSIIKRAKDYYFREWKGREKTCPAFGEKVYLTKLGWNHIVHHPRRTLTDKIIRLKKLSLAREILEKATTYQTLQKKGIPRYFQSVGREGGYLRVIFLHFQTVFGVECIDLKGPSLL